MTENTEYFNTHTSEIEAMLQILVLDTCDFHLVRSQDRTRWIEDLKNIANILTKYTTVLSGTLANLETIDRSMTNLENLRSKLEK